ncbi:unnamed protein product [Symbiodinium natans]|uniref:Uncharacterized protein n=1 Tax=Symbiodinium natans TaxID=878477 RepID=A0A812QCD9_9DINO|nr:unnamed protein product [Symbiodinium natans]
MPHYSPFNTILPLLDITITQHYPLPTTTHHYPRLRTTPTRLAILPFHVPTIPTIPMRAPGSETGSSLTFIWRTDLKPLLLAIEGASALPLIGLFLVATRLCFHGAALTEKCRNIPALVNQIPGDAINPERQYLVRFITDSAAGFILKGVTLTPATFQRQAGAL